MYTSIEDNRKKGMKSAKDMRVGECFMFDGSLCMVIDNYEHAYDGDDYIYGVILTDICGDNDNTGNLVKVENYSLVEAVTARANFTIV